jgi:hypothetical protein
MGNDGGWRICIGTSMKDIPGDFSGYISRHRQWALFEDQFAAGHPSENGSAVSWLIDCDAEYSDHRVIRWTAGRVIRNVL